MMGIDRDGLKVELSIILPVYEEEGSIETLVREIFRTLEDAGRQFEVVVIDDGSGDRTMAILQGLKDRFRERLVVARHPANRGNGAALRTGINIASGEIVITMDADGQHAPADILKLIERIPPNDLVIGARMEGYAGSWYRNAANGFYNRFASWLSRVEIKDLTSGFRAMRRQAVQHFLPLFPTGFSAPTTTTLAFIKAGYSVEFLPIHVRQRETGTSKIHLFEDGSRFVMIILRMIMLFDPMRIFLPTSVALGILGVLTWVAGLLNAHRLVLPNSSILLFSSALITWLLGLLSDQISSSRIHYHGDEHVQFME